MTTHDAHPGQDPAREPAQDPGGSPARGPDSAARRPARGPGGDEDLWSHAAAAFAAWDAGDQAGLDELVRLLTPVLWHVVRSYRIDQASAEDVVQTTWMTLLRRRATIRDAKAVGGWLTVTARREAWRVARADTRADPVEIEVLDRKLPCAGSAESEAVEHDQARLVWDAVEALPERCRRLLRIVAFDDRPDYGRISYELDMPIGSIGPTRGRCLRKLQAQLAETGDPR